MGVDTNVWVGAYLKIKKAPSDPQADIKVTYTCKCEHDCAPDKETFFCSKCGKRAKTRIKTKKVTLNAWELLEKIKSERLSPCEDLPVMIPNRKTKYGYFLDVDEGIALEKPEVYGPVAIEEFKILFDKELSKLDKLGVEYEICSGVLLYFS